MTYILGLNAYHGDASACLLRNGVLVAAVEEERFKRIKHWAGLPVDSIRYCLSEAGISLKDLAAISINSNPHANLFRKVFYTVSRRPGLRLLRDRVKSRAKRLSIMDSISNALNDGEFKGELRFIEHHLAHLAAAFFPSPYDKALVLSVDGFGDFASTAWGVGHRNSLAIDKKIYFPHSLGMFYEAITRFLGFKAFGDEYKIMGLAPYGTNRYEKAMATLLRLEEEGSFSLDLQYFNHHRGHEIVTWDGCAPVTGDSYSAAIEDLLGPPRLSAEPITQKHMDIARSAQVRYEDALFHLVRHLHSLHRIDLLALGGGCAFNSVANGRLYANTPVKDIYVQPAAGDAGGALGAALYSWHVHENAKRAFKMDHAYWGPSYSDKQIGAQLAARQAEMAEHNCSYLRMEWDALITHVASAVAAGQVVGWFQGRMEWGPRALGNRSILCDPRRANMKDILNKKIKRREEFRPFAPSILREAVNEWFETDDHVPFMMKVFQVRDDRRAIIPAVTHVDGSGRLQTVERHQNPLLYSLIEAFSELTGVPLLLNTSFNQNEPIVCTAGEAVECFLRTQMDMLVLGRHVIFRNDKPPVKHFESEETCASVPHNSTVFISRSE